jgi:hypothetical protein
VTSRWWSGVTVALLGVVVVLVCVVVTIQAARWVEHNCGANW